MTRDEAIRALLDEYALETMVDLVRDEVKYSDPEFKGLSHEHPRVKKFEAICRTLRAEVRDV